jgi:N-methylhydantoinase B/oxoprolinase/acetone carboxylase alpha subunit
MLNVATPTAADKALKLAQEGIPVFPARLLKHETLRSREFEFLQQMSKRRARPSDAQEKWLRDIEARLAGEAAVA